MENKSFGLIAGNGEFPLLFLQEANRLKIPCVVVALKGETDPAIENISSKVTWINIGHLDEIISTFKKENINKAVMCGQVVHTKIFTEVKLDWRAIKLLAFIKDRKTDSILKAVADEMKKDGVELVSSVTLMESFVPHEQGSLFKIKISDEVKQEIDFGFKMAKGIAGLDIGQTVVVKERAVVAVESLEGTDKCIERAYELAGDGVIVVKVSKPNQDMRFDVPVLGLKTFKTLEKVKAKAIAFESGKTLFLNREESLEIAKRNNIVVYAI